MQVIDHPAATADSSPVKVSDPAPTATSVA